MSDELIDPKSGLQVRPPGTRSNFKNHTWTHKLAALNGMTPKAVKFGASERAFKAIADHAFMYRTPWGEEEVEVVAIKVRSKAEHFADVQRVAIVAVEPLIAAMRAGLEISRWFLDDRDQVSVVLSFPDENGKRNRRRTSVARILFNVSTEYWARFRWSPCALVRSGWFLSKPSKAAREHRVTIHDAKADLRMHKIARERKNGHGWSAMQDIGKHLIPRHKLILDKFCALHD